MKVLGICGSLREGSVCLKVLKLFGEEVLAHSGDWELVDLREFDLPFCDGSGKYSGHPDVERLENLVQDADAIVLATPEYHGSLSGVLKNALDLLDEACVEGKLIGLITVLGGVSSMNAANTLRVICRQMGAWVVPEQLLIPRADSAFDLEGQFTDENHFKRMKQLITQLLEKESKPGPLP